MIVGYNSLLKAYRLSDIETSHLLYGHDVFFDEQQGPFIPVSLEPDPTDQPMKAHDSEVRLPLGLPDGRALVAPTALVIHVIPI